MGRVGAERRVASSAVITKLVELGYLQPGARHRATAVQRAIERLRSDLVRQGVIYDSNLSSSAEGWARLFGFLPSMRPSLT